MLQRDRNLFIPRLIKKHLLLEQNGRMQVALYGRVSTKDKGQDTENQLGQLREFCQRRGWTIVHEYVDRKSAKNGDRDEFQKLFADAAQHKFDLVLFWSLDRFSREGVLETLQYLQRLTGYGINWRSFTEQYLDSCGIFKDAVLSILATIAKQERIRLSARVQAGLAKARKQGRVGGRPRLVLDRAKIAQLDVEGWTLREIGEELGVSQASICRALKAYRCAGSNLIPV